MKLTLNHLQPENDQVITYWFKPDQPADQIAGQFLELTLPHEPADHRGNRRWFTISSSPTEPLLAITTKFASPKDSGDGSSFKRAMQQLKPGDSLDASDPLGDFVVPLNPQIPLVFIAGGIGITPFHSIIQWLQATTTDADGRRPIQLFYSVSQPQDFLFMDLFEAAPIDFTPIVTRSTPDWQGQTQPLTAAYIMEHAKPAPGSLVFISGPESMVIGLRRELIAAGLNSQQIVTDAFPGYN